MSLLNKFKKVNIFFLLKTGIGSAISIILAESLGFSYSPSAGIITLLTIQNTKKETISIALRRIEAFILAVVISYVAFRSFGYTAIAFGVFVFLFVALCHLFSLQDGISMNAVLMTHFLIEKRMDFPLILNEIALLFIGMVIGIALNLIMPKYRERIRREQNNLDGLIKLTLRGMSNMLREKDSCLIQGEDILIKEKDILIKDNEKETLIKDNEKETLIKDNEKETLIKDNEKETLIKDSEKETLIKDKYIMIEEKQLTSEQVPTDEQIPADEQVPANELLVDIKVSADDQQEVIDFYQIDILLEGLLKKAYEDAGNTLLSDTKYLVSYLEMRKLQIGVLKDIKENIEHIPVLLRQTFPIADFMDNIADSFHELNNAHGLIKEIEELQEHFRKEKLPETRDEFEYRAILFQILKELEYFLLLKRNFILELDNKNMKSYWSR